MNHYVPLTMHSKKPVAVPRKKERVNFDDLYAERAALMDKMSITELRACREDLKSWIDNINDLSREQDIKPERKKYLSGLRKMVLNLLAYSKTRIREINKQVYCGTTTNQAIEFVRIAAEVLPHNTYQEIMGRVINRDDRTD
uniref:Uncharacterized protein n=1 Tax=viral metagenome TaxID=1070528 RepID=A0A6M3J043_9ZZZZ